jgi:signal transduction histidine kinase
MLGLELKIATGVIMVVQLLAIGYAMHLVRRTKYSIIWILCIIAFAISFAEHLFEIFLNKSLDFELLIGLDAVASLCVVVAVFFAHRLVNHLDRLNYQRSLFNNRLISAVLRTEERSRAEFAKELHDGMGPLLSSAKMSLSAITTENMSKEQADILNNTRFVIDEAIRSVREISNNMSPQVLEDFGLSRGVHNFISRLQSFYGVEIEFRSGIHDERFDHDIEVVLYRVICELINNSLKHSGCKNIDISLLLKGTTIELCYHDNGCGFDTASAMSKGMGLSNITSRISSLNGDLQIESGIGKGLKVVARINTKQDETTINNQRKRRWKKR